MGILNGADFPELAGLQNEFDAFREKAWEAWSIALQRIADRYGVNIATGHMSNTYQCRKPHARYWRAEYDFQEGRQPEVFKALEEFDEMMEPFGCGPSNLLYIKCKKTKP